VINPDWGPFLFDTSAESWFSRAVEPRAAEWWRGYLGRYPVHVSSITVYERTRGYALLWQRADPGRRPAIEAARAAYLEPPRQVWPVDTATAAVAGEIAALLPEPPSAPKRSHKRVESRAERLARWRFDGLIAATALVSGLTLIHNNPHDFEAIRSGIEIHPERFVGLGPLHLIRCGAVIAG
jgi:predicted nucleic acid-binding protein